MDCPPYHILQKLGTDPEGDSIDPALEGHLEECPRCRSILERMLRTDLGGFASTVDDLQSPGTTVAPPHLPGFDGLQELGRGGFGVVYKARQASLNVWRAVKVLPVDTPGSVRQSRLGLREARAAARVIHPHVVRTFDVVVSGDRPFIVMEYLQGGTLAARVRRDGPPSPEIVARIGAALADAVEAIHREGLVHGDIKPSNVLLRGTSDRPLDRCEPVIGDFGLACESSPLGDGASGTLRGTPGYMAPEWATGASRDVYALGATLYFLIVGRPPILGESPGEILSRQLADGPPPIRTLRPGVSRDLVAIAMKCLSIAPERRYATAGALAEDLRRFLAGRPVAARPIGPMERGWRCMRRPSTARVAVAGCLAVALTGWIAGPRAVPASARAEADTADDEAMVRILVEFSERIIQEDVQDVHSAAKSAEKALRECDAVLTRRPDDASLRFARARLAFVLGRCLGSLGESAMAIDRLTEAADSGIRLVEKAPDDVLIRYTTGLFLREQGVSLLEAGRFEECFAALQRHREILEPIRNHGDVEHRVRDSKLLHATALSRGRRYPEFKEYLATLLAEQETFTAAHSDAAWAWAQLAAVHRLAYRPGPAVAAQRRALALQPEDGPTAFVLVTNLVNLIQATRDSRDRAALIAEADGLMAADVGRLRREAERLPSPVVQERRLAEWGDMGSLLDAHRMRVDDPYATLEARLRNAVAAEGDDATIDAGWMAESCEALVAEFAVLAAVASNPDHAPWAASSAAQTFLDGMDRIEAGDVVAGRLLIIEAVARGSFFDRDRGERARAESLCSLCRDGLARIKPEPGDVGLLHHVAREVWTQTAKNLWDYDRPATHEALIRAVAEGQAASDQAPDSGTFRSGVDNALARLSRFEFEDGNPAVAESLLTRRLALWPPASREAALAAVDLARLARAARAADTASTR